MDHAKTPVTLLMDLIIYSELSEAELYKISEIDRGEKIDGIYEFRNNALILKKHTEIFQGFEKDELDQIINRQLHLHKEKGKIIGAFKNTRLIGVISIERKKVGRLSNYCKMDILYVDKNHRAQGIGKQLIAKSKTIAKGFGAEKLYISATPTKNTVDFYLANGAGLTQELDAGLYSLEPEDIHLEMDVLSIKKTT